ncbi:MAG: ABC-type transport auxiliary lipoprotein family protein [Myxococcales bacterium]
MSVYPSARAPEGALRRRWRLGAVASALALLLAGVLGGCSALFSKSEPLSVRYFALPERAATRTEGGVQDLAPLRLGRVRGAAHLDVRMVHRRADNELVYDESVRWSENPARYLERAIAHALFEERGIAQAMSGRALTLEAELLAFEAVETEGAQRARVSVAFTLHDERTSRLVETLRVERELTADAPDALAAALASALDEAVNRVVERVLPELAAAREGSAPVQAALP